MTDLIYTAPKTLEMLSTEVLPIAIDVAALVDQGESPSAPLVAVTDQDTGQAVTSGIGAPAFTDTICTIGIGPLAAGVYRLQLSFTVAPGKKRACLVLLEVS